NKAKMSGTEWIRMSEQEWLSSTDSQPMLLFLGSTGLDRKLRLFACGCARRVSHLCEHEVPREMLELGERFADGLVSREKLWPLVQRANKLVKELYEQRQSVVFYAAAALSSVADVAGKPSQQQFEGYAAAVSTAH